MYDGFRMGVLVSALAGEALARLAMAMAIRRRRFVMVSPGAWPY
jgi:hypothetical protein